jgi:hypothetical protein
VFGYWQTWSLTLREERRLRVLRRVFGPKRDVFTGEWRKMHNEELNDLYPLPNIVRVVKSRRMRWAEHVARMVEDRGVYRVLVGKPEGKRPLKADSHIACRAHAVPLPCRAAKGLECVFSILFTQCGRV